MQNTKTAESPFGTVELTPEERNRREQSAGAVNPEFDIMKRNAIVSDLAAELWQAIDMEKRAEREYRQAMETRIECTNVLMRAVMNLRHT